MNFKDIDPEGLLVNTRRMMRQKSGYRPSLLEMIFIRQGELMELYRPIEERILGEELPHPPLSLHSAKHQAWLKQRAWWVTEELIEAQWGCWEINPDKLIEELADALHFQTELCILAGVSPKYTPALPRMWPAGELEMNPLVLRHYTMAVLEELGIGLWQFRNKAWKQTQVLTDIDVFTKCMERAHWGIVELLGLAANTDLEGSVTLYLCKSEVNLWRIYTQY